MSKKHLKQTLENKLGASTEIVFLRSDFSEMGEYAKVGRALSALINDGVLVRIGYGLYTRGRISLVTGEPTIDVPGGFKVASRAALSRLGYQWVPGTAEIEYKMKISTQIPANAEVIIQKPFSRKIEFGALSLCYRTVKKLPIRCDTVVPRRNI